VVGRRAGPRARAADHALADDPDRGRPGRAHHQHLILNLNEPNRIEDTSWIEPARYVGIWWEMHLDKSTWGSGPRHGATTENAMRYIDFAAEHGFPHVLVEGWNTGWDGEWYASGVVFDFTQPYPDFDLEAVARYARERGVRLMGHHETSASVEHYEGQMEEAFALYERLGVRAVKTGYVGHGREITWTDDEGTTHHEWHHGQYMVNHHQRVVELAARHRILLNVHEGLMDTGLRRTWPNLMTREVARGQEYNAWGGGEDLWDGPATPPTTWSRSPSPASSRARSTTRRASWTSTSTSTSRSTGSTTRWRRSWRSTW
jgi:alpha-glucosidase